MTAQWDSYLRKVNGHPASIYLDLSYRKEAPDRSRPNALFVLLTLLHPNPENGMSTRQEFDALKKIEDVLCPAVVRKYRASYVGRITSRGRREFYFYSAGADEFEAFAKRTMSKFSGYSIEAGAKSDPHWKHYLTCLYPDDDRLRWMADRRVVEVLKSKGDVLHIERPVIHFAYFPSAAGRKKFRQFLAANGFDDLQDSESGEPRGELPYGISCMKRQPATLDEIFRTTSLLDARAGKLGGDYDGWEAELTEKAPRQKAPVKRK